MIDLVGSSKRVDGVQVLKNINLYIRKKEFMTLLGPSGCGKTTTLRIIGGFETPIMGEVFFDGQDIAARAALQAPRQHGFPEVRAVPAPECV